MEIGESLLTKAAECLMICLPDVPSKRKFPPKMYPSQTIVRLNDPISGVVKFSLISALLFEQNDSIRKMNNAHKFVPHIDSFRAGNSMH